MPQEGNLRVVWMSNNTGSSGEIIPVNSVEHAEEIISERAEKESNDPSIGWNVADLQRYESDLEGDGDWYTFYDDKGREVLDVLKGKEEVS